MKQHEREFFVSMVRSGKVIIRNQDLTLTILPPTIEQNLEACFIYNEAYNQGYIDGIMTEEEMLEWMINNGLWSQIDDDKTEGFKKDLEKLKIEIYNARNDGKLRERIRMYIRAGELQLASHLYRKTQYYQNTREGYATTEKTSWLIKNTTYSNNQLYDFESMPISYVMDEWQSSILSDSQCRELSRNEPWKSVWSTRENSGHKLFFNPDNCELTHNQKNLVIWSQLYDNVQESVDCPPQDIINDDDMFDGWMIIQSRKRESEKAEQELRNSSNNEKIKNASEVYVMAGSEKDVSRITNMNDPYSKKILQQRTDLLNKKGSVPQNEFADEQLKMRMQLTNMSRRH